MRVLTIGGATQDMYLMHKTSDMMTLEQNNLKVDYMLLRAGSKVEVETINRFVGGGATNAAASFKKLGFDVSCFCNLGTDENATFILEELKQLGIDTSSITQTTQHPTGTSFILKAGSNDRTIFAFRGANEAMQQDKIPYDQIKQANQLYITSLSKNSSNLLPDIVTFAHKNNIPVAINPGMSQLAGGAKILQQALPYIDTFILNYEEAKAFMISLAQDNELFKKAFTFSPDPRSCPIDLIETAHELLDDQPYLIDNPIACENLTFSIRQFFKQILALGPRIVVITNSSNGVYAATKDEIFYHPSIKTTVVNTVGAGDSFGSCFVGSLHYNDSIIDALRNGIINASSVLGELGAKKGLLSREVLKERALTIDNSLVKKFKL